MYAPRFFRERSVERMIALVREHCFGTIVSVHAGRAIATHLPVLIEGAAETDLRILSHFARANEQGKALGDGDEVLAMFQGPHGYITPSWYREEEDVPTYNYSAVHIRGIYRPIEDPAEVRRLLEQTVHHFEQHSSRPWMMEDISPTVVEGFMKGVTCFSIEVTSIEGVAKHSQDKSAADRTSILTGLKVRDGEGDPQLLDGMKASLRD
ncbi:MAG: FMN-binding negative transcriptional regulator [Parvularcula sp.]|jgi:transcriptional regulator|nr:FMN-binding negative transcriptional regulator [Parvularcula sp.]